MKTAVLIFAVFLVAALALPLLGMLLRLFITTIAGVAMLAVSLIAGIGYISLALASIALVAIYQSGLHLGWAIVVALRFGLGAVVTLLRAIWCEIRHKVSDLPQNWPQNNLSFASKDYNEGNSISPSRRDGHFPLD